MKVLRKYENQSLGSILNQLQGHNYDRCVMSSGTPLHIMVGKKEFCEIRLAGWEKNEEYNIVLLSEIWDALRAAAEADLTLAQAIVDSAGLLVQTPDLTICYDERGAKYELPKYVMSEPTNLIPDS